MMDKKADRTGSCTTCHDVSTDPVELVSMGRENQGALALDAVKSRVDAQEPPKMREVPETLLLGRIADVYEPAEFPHGRIIRTLEQKMAGSRMARVFHPSAATVCQGCHHNSPASETPPGCVSCHDGARQGQVGRPGLKGAYHGQCIDCHEAMNMDKIAANDCIKCHRKK
jgi:hypothetical protein